MFGEFLEKTSREPLCISVTYTVLNQVKRTRPRH